MKEKEESLRKKSGSPRKSSPPQIVYIADDQESIEERAKKVSETIEELEKAQTITQETLLKEFTI